MPQHVILTANITVRQSRISVEVTDAEQRDGPLPTSYRQIERCDVNSLVAIANRRDGEYRDVRFRPGVGTADFTERPADILWTQWRRMAGHFHNRYGQLTTTGWAFIGPVRTGGAGDTQWAIDTASGLAESANLIREACMEFVELGVASSKFDENGKSIGLTAYGQPVFTSLLEPYQNDIDRVLQEEWSAYAPGLTAGFTYEVRPIRLQVCDTLVGSDLPLIVIGNRRIEGSVGALEFVLTVERNFNNRQVAIVDLESIRDGTGNITGFLHREIRVVYANNGAARAYGLHPYGGIAEHGLNPTVNGSTAKDLLNTKSKAALAAAQIWPRR